MWVLVLSLVVLGIICYFADKWMRKTGRLKDVEQEEKQELPDTEECCGEHDICEKDSFIRMSDNIVYYDDEELDAYKGISPEQYTEEIIQEFEDVFYTLQEKDVPGWTHSLQLRNIELPDNLKDEVLMVMRERRFQTIKQ